MMKRYIVKYEIKYLKEDDELKLYYLGSMVGCVMTSLYLFLETKLYTSAEIEMNDKDINYLDKFSISFYANDETYDRVIDYIYISKVDQLYDDFEITCDIKEVPNE